MNAYTFKPISRPVANHVSNFTKPILNDQYPNPGDAADKKIAQTGVQDFIKKGEPDGHPQIPQSNDEHAPLRTYVGDLASSYRYFHRQHEAQSIVLSNLVKKAPSAPQTHDHSILVDELRDKEHTTMGQLAAAKTLLNFRDGSLLPEPTNTSSSSIFPVIDGSGLIATAPLTAQETQVLQRGGGNSARTMNNSTFTPFPANVAQRVNESAQILLALEYPDSNEASTKDITNGST